MLKDNASLNAKGHVKLELYNEDGVFFTKEKKNLVVQSANEIVANMMADPAKVLRVSQVDKGETALSANSDLLYPFALTVQHEVKVKLEKNWGASNVVKEFYLDELKGITSLDKVSIAGETLLINQDVFLLDATEGKIKFAVAPTSIVEIQFHKIKNPYMDVIAGTEKVTVNGTVWERATTANSADKKYQVNYKTGQILFDAVTSLISVEYDYNMNYSLGFMALGGKPNPTDPNYKPVEFGNTNRLDTYMKNELANSRMPVSYPASVSIGATELEPAIPTQPIATVLKTKKITVGDIGDGSTKELIYSLDNLHDSGSGQTGRELSELVSVVNSTSGADILGKTIINSNTASKVSIEFKAADVEIGNVIEVSYRLKLDNRHLIYQLGQSPVVKLVSVRHTSSNDQTDIREYAIVDSGLRVGQGDVWISNPNTGHITFSQAPVGTNPSKPAPKVDSPGQLTVEYMVNSGTTVRFVADFPKGVPAPNVEDAPAKVVNAVIGQSAIALDYAIAKDAFGSFIEPTVTVDGIKLTSAGYSISVDGRTITPNSLSADQIVEVKYKYEKSTHDIYQVAMFDDKSGGKMFNISGIGPVTKDLNTGMRVTWSVTF